MSIYVPHYYCKYPRTENGNCSFLYELSTNTPFYVVKEDSYKVWKDAIVFYKLRWRKQKQKLMCRVQPEKLISSKCKCPFLMTLLWITFTDIFPAKE